jgi:glucosamine 6-phosphate synthetase-like amidotransferase/phosphosugar isomerase protein
MCGILGMGLQKGCDISNPQLLTHLLRELLFESKSRGSDATGVAFASGYRIGVIKNNVDASEFVATREFSSACRRYIKIGNIADTNMNTTAILGHTRAKTKGTPLVRYNNHPIVTSNIVGVHNGIITNDEALFTEYKEKYKPFERKGEVDSEIIFQLIDYFVTVRNMPMSQAILETSGLLKGSYACALIHRKNPYQLWLFRDYNPATLVCFEDVGLVMFASSLNFIRTAITGMPARNLGPATEILFPQHHCVGINLFTKSLYIFKLRSQWANRNSCAAGCCA